MEESKRRCVREVEPFDDEFMIVAGDPAYIDLCSSLAARIQEISLKAQADDAADETSQEEQASTISVSGRKMAAADSRCICMGKPASGCPCASGAVISNAWLDQWASCARPPSNEAGEGFASRTLLCVLTAPKLRNLAEQGVEAIREIRIAGALAKSIKKAQVPLPLLFYTTDTHQFVGLFEVHPDGIAIQSEREATAVVYRRLQLMPLSMAAIRSVLPQLAKHVSSQLKSPGPPCIILDGVQNVNKLFEMMLQETAQRRQLQCTKLLEESVLGPFCVLSGLERASAARKETSGRARPPLSAVSSSDVLRLMAGKRTLFVGDLLARQLYRYVLALLQGKEADHDPNNAEFGEMSFSDDILLHRAQASVWSADYIEEREMRSSPPAASTNSMMMMRAATPSQISIVRLYYRSALTADNVEEVVNHVANVADKLRIDNIYVCFGAMQTIVQAAPTATFLRQLSEAFHQFVSGLAEQLQCPMTCLLNPPSSCGEMPESCPASQTARAATDLQLQLFNDVVRSLHKQYAFEVADLWTVGAELLADQLDDGAQYHTDAIQKFLFEVCRPLLDKPSKKAVSKTAQPEVAMFPGKGLSQRHLEVPIENEVVWLHRNDAILAYKFEGDDGELYSVTPFDESSSFRSVETVHPQEVLLKLDPLSALQSAPPPLPQVEDTAPSLPSTSVSAAIAMEPQDQVEDQGEKTDFEQIEASPQQTEEAVEAETTEAPQTAEQTEEQVDHNEEDSGDSKKPRRSARKRRESNTPTTGKRRRQQRTIDDLEVAMAYDKQAAVRENDEGGD